MGIRGELYSNRVQAEGRTYFFNVKENRMGDVFLNIVESKPGEHETFERRSVVVFKEDMKVFLGALDGALQFMEKQKSAKTSKPGSPRRAIREGMVEGEYRDLDDEYRDPSASRATATHPTAPRGERREAPGRGRTFGDRPEGRSAPRRSEGDRASSYRSDDRRPAPKRDGETRPYAKRPSESDRPRDGERRVSLVGDDRPAPRGTQRATYARKAPGDAEKRPARTARPAKAPAGKRVVVRKKKDSASDDFIGD